MKKLLLPNMDGCDKVCCVSHRSPPQFFKNPVFNTSRRRLMQQEDLYTHPHSCHTQLLLDKYTDIIDRNKYNNNHI